MNDDFTPPELWGRDHWSTLAYVESVATDCAGFEVGADARMRANRRNFRTLRESNPRPRRVGPSTMSAGVAMDKKYSTRLRDGMRVDGHDDWECVRDLAAAGLFTVSPAAVRPRETLHLSAEGQRVAAALRAHKQTGGAFHEFAYPGREDDS